MLFPADGTIIVIAMSGLINPFSHACSVGKGNRRGYTTCGMQRTQFAIRNWAKIDNRTDVPPPLGGIP